MKIIEDSKVQAKILEYPAEIQKMILESKEIIKNIINKDDRIGDIIETLKWDVPSYLPKNRRVGTTVRLSFSDKRPDFFGLYVHCQTTLISDFKSVFENKFTYVKNRGVLFHKDEKLPLKDIELMILKALTYHLVK